MVIKKVSKIVLFSILSAVFLLSYQNCAKSDLTPLSQQLPNEDPQPVIAQALFSGDQRNTETAPTDVQKLMESIAGRVTVDDINYFLREGELDAYQNDRDPNYQYFFRNNDEGKGKYVWIPRCSDQRSLSHYPKVAGCTFSLVAGDLLLTAGHCMDEIGDCDKYGFIFNLSYYNSNNDPKRPKKRDIRYCKSIEYMQDDVEGGNDIALIRLDAQAKRQPLFMNLNKNFKLANNTRVSTIGHSESWPLTWSPNGRHKGLSNGNSFYHSIDAFGWGFDHTFTCSD